jgi:quercetin dioxygenase-like cupin family protein
MEYSVDKGFPKSIKFSFNSIVDVAIGAVVSKTIIKKPAGTVTLFAFDKNEGLSEHSAPFDALVSVVEGKGLFTIGGEPHTLEAGESIIMPANVPHSVKAIEAFKMLLVMIKQV